MCPIPGLHQGLHLNTGNFHKLTCSDFYNLPIYYFIVCIYIPYIYTIYCKLGISVVDMLM